MPDHESLRIDVRPIGQHDHKNDFFGAGVEVGIHNAVIAGSVQRGDGPV